MSDDIVVTTIYQGDGLTININNVVRLYHVFIVGLKPRSFPTIEGVQQYIFKKMGQVINFVSEPDGQKGEQ